jgi:hypothetical protein
MLRVPYRGAATIVLALTLCVGAVGCSGGGSTPKSSTRTSTGLPQASNPALDAGRQLITTKCTLCHPIDRIQQANHDAAGWAATVTRMQTHGLVATDAELKQILDYLASR